MSSEIRPFIFLTFSLASLANIQITKYFWVYCLLAVHATRKVT